MKSLFRISYYDGGQPAHSYVLASTVGEAARHLGVGVSQFGAGTEIARDVEITGIDKAHVAVTVTPANVLPPYVPLFSPAELEDLESVLSLDEIVALPQKLTPEELGNLRQRRLMPQEVEGLKLILRTRPAHGQAYRNA